MKKTTCKILLIIGIILITSTISSPFWMDFDNLFIYVNLISILFIVGIILIIISLVKWNSERKETERQETRQAQLEALKRGNVNIELNSKMRKLK